MCIKSHRRNLDSITIYLFKIMTNESIQFSTLQLIFKSDFQLRRLSGELVRTYDRLRLVCNTIITIANPQYDIRNIA